MDELKFQLTHFAAPTLQQILDIAVVAYLTYRLLLMVRGSRAWRIIGGIVIYLLLWFASDLLGLRTIHFILDKALVLGPVALVILLLPELRSALEGFGKLGFWPERLGGGEDQTDRETIEAIVSAASELSRNRRGALMVIERSRKLPEIEKTGIALNARVSAALLESVFYGENPLHDGAAMIRGNTLVAASCQLPLSEMRLKPHMHMRHRAAVGASEGTDAVCIIVSEERGLISIAQDGRIQESINPENLRELLNMLLTPSNKQLSFARTSKKKAEDEKAAVS